MSLPTSVPKTAPVTPPVSKATPAPHNYPIMRYGSFLKPQAHNIYIDLGAEEGGGAGGAITAALDNSSRAHQTGDVLVSLSLIAILLFASFIATFFWRKYRKISLLRGPRPYGYSQLSQTEREAVEVSEIADDVEMNISTSTDEEELEPATINVTSSYVTPQTSIKDTNEKGHNLNDNSLNVNKINDMNKHTDSNKTVNNLIQASLIDSEDFSQCTTHTFDCPPPLNGGESFLETGPIPMVKGTVLTFHNTTTAETSGSQQARMARSNAKKKSSKSSKTKRGKLRTTCTMSLEVSHGTVSSAEHLDRPLNGNIPGLLPMTNDDGLTRVRITEMDSDEELLQ